MAIEGEGQPTAHHAWWEILRSLWRKKIRSFSFGPQEFTALLFRELWQEMGW